MKLALLRPSAYAFALSTQENGVKEPHGLRVHILFPLAILSSHDVSSDLLINPIDEGGTYLPWLQDDVHGTLCDLKSTAEVFAGPCS